MTTTRIIIPVYQRGYDWESEEHVGAFWNDVLDHSPGGKFDNEAFIFLDLFGIKIRL